MSGHSKWANIKRKKSVADAAKSNVFTKIGREIAVAVKLSGSDPQSNNRLADAIAKAKANNIPNDTITRCVKKAAGELNAVNYENMVYEGYGVGGSAVMVACLTDNKNRTVGEIRHVFDKYGAGMGAAGCVSFMFDYKGVIIIERNLSLTEDIVTEYALEAGADDVITYDDIFEIYSSPTDFSAVRQYFEDKKLTVLEAELKYVAKSTVSLDAEKQEKFDKMLEKFDESDDVQNVFHNVEIDA